MLAATSEDAAVAGRIARELAIPLLDAAPADVQAALPATLFIEVLDRIPRLRPLGRRSPGPVAVGFEGQALAQRRAAGHNELLGRAVGWRAAAAPRVLDATAGYGQDAFVLADLGCDVTLCERNPVMACLLREALRRATESADPWLRGVGTRMQLCPGDVRERGMPSEPPDVIYLDPMFTAPRKTAPVKSMQILQMLTEAEAAAATGLSSDSVGANAAIGDDAVRDGDAIPTDEAIAVDDAIPDDDALLDWALQQPVRRVVVKRPRRAAPLLGRRPGHELSGRAVRFDVYPLGGPQ